MMDESEKRYHKILIDKTSGSKVIKMGDSGR